MYTNWHHMFRIWAEFPYSGCIFRVLYMKEIDLKRIDRLGFVYLRLAWSSSHLRLWLHLSGYFDVNFQNWTNAQNLLLTCTFLPAGGVNETPLAFDLKPMEASGMKIRASTARDSVSNSCPIFESLIHLEICNSAETPICHKLENYLTRV